MASRGTRTTVRVAVPDGKVVWETKEYDPTDVALLNRLYNTDKSQRATILALQMRAASATKAGRFAHSLQLLLDQLHADGMLTTALVVSATPTEVIGAGHLKDIGDQLA